jgi:hypothetical protein
MYVIKLSWRSGKISGFSRYGSMPGKGEGIAFLLDSRQSFLESPGRRVRGQHKLKSAASAPCGVGSATTPTSLLSMAPCPVYSWTAATRKPRRLLRYSGVNLLRYAGRQNPA